MQKVKFACAVLLAACGSAAVQEGAAEVLEDAGEVLTDAGRALQDAGGWLDGSTADAQADAAADPVQPAPVRRTLTAACDQVTERKTSAGVWGEFARWARFEGVELEEVRGVWVCRDTPFDALRLSDTTETRGMPQITCTQGAAYAAEGVVWVGCAYAEETVKLIVE